MWVVWLHVFKNSTLLYFEFSFAYIPNLIGLTCKLLLFSVRCYILYSRGENIKSLHVE